MDYNVKHICINGIPRTTPCIYRGIMNSKGFIFNKVSCPICKKEFVIEELGRIIN